MSTYKDSIRAAEIHIKVAADIGKWVDEQLLKYSAGGMALSPMLLKMFESDGLITLGLVSLAWIVFAYVIVRIIMEANSTQKYFEDLTDIDIIASRRACQCDNDCGCDNADVAFHRNFKELAVTRSAESKRVLHLPLAFILGVVLLICSGVVSFLTKL